MSRIAAKIVKIITLAFQKSGWYNKKGTWIEIILPIENALTTNHESESAANHKEYLKGKAIEKNKCILPLYPFGCKGFLDSPG